MFIGGSPGSCAGGIKTTTFRILAAFLLANFRGRNQAIARQRAFGEATVQKALFCWPFGLHIIFAASFLILLLEQGASPHEHSKPFFDIFFRGGLGLLHGRAFNQSYVRAFGRKQACSLHIDVRGQIGANLAIGGGPVLPGSSFLQVSG